MIRSMTGYGTAKGNTCGYEITVEIKSVNNRYLETSVRLPRSFMFAEDAIKERVASHISRGKVDVFINASSSENDDIIVKVNNPLAKSYIQAIKDIADSYGLNPEISAKEIARMPDVLSIERGETDSEELTNGICAIAEQALTDYDRMRSREGEKLREDVSSRLVTIENFIRTIENTAPETARLYKERLEQKMREVLEDRSVDESRLIQEVAIFADHIAIDEETVRLRSHISQLHGMLENGSPIGRKIDFLVQEFNREANTIGSKCQNSEISHVVVDLKSEIEKIREQIQNIE